MMEKMFDKIRNIKMFYCSISLLIAFGGKKWVKMDSVD